MNRRRAESLENLKFSEAQLVQMREGFGFGELLTIGKDFSFNNA